VSIAEKFYTMEYGAAPEDPKEAVQWLERHHRRFEEFIGGAWVEAGAASTRPPAIPRRRDAGRGGQGKHRRRERRRGAARKAQPGWQALSGHERARYLYALARQVQKHSRRLAVLETMDNGKPIRESRDIDIPLVARHFYHHAGWAQLLDGVSQLHGVRRGGPGDSVEFSAADVCVEGGAGAGRGQHGGHQAGKIYAADGAGVCRAGMEVGLPPAC
jgi:hypothetical protein